MSVYGGGMGGEDGLMKLNERKIILCVLHWNKSFHRIEGIEEGGGEEHNDEGKKTRRHPIRFSSKRTEYGWTLHRRRTPQPVAYFQV